MTETVFPSEEWFELYEDAINDHEEYNESSEGWGVEFNGDFSFKMPDMPGEDLDFDAMPDDIREEMETYVKETDTEGYVGHSFVQLEDGTCQGARLIESPDEVEEGFMLTGTYDNWVSLIQGDIGAVDGMMSGKFDLDGDMQKVLQYTDSATMLTEIAGSIDAVFAHEAFGN
jgi:putative sterol carrier protein